VTDTKEGEGGLLVSVDRVEGKRVVMESDDGRRFEMERSGIPVRVSEGSILRVPLAESGELDWQSARRDRTEERRRRDDLSARLKLLQTDDTGGDVTL
jgi:hypothetical protein